MTNRIFLALTALMFVAFGLWSIVDPIGMTTRLGVEAGGVSGVFEMRGVFGGVSLGAASLCLLGTLRQRFEFPALCFIAAYMGAPLPELRNSELVFKTTASFFPKPGKKLSCV